MYFFGYRKYFVLVLFVLGGCSAATNTVYHKDFTSAFSTSKPIYLSFKDNKNSSFYFLLEHKAPSNDYLLRIRWLSSNKALLFDNDKTIVKFLIDNSDIFTIKPIKSPRIIAYNLENNGHTEEAIFSLSLDQMKTIANAKKVSVELTGRYVNVVGHFNRMQTFKIFKNFLEKS